MKLIKTKQYKEIKETTELKSLRFRPLSWYTIQTGCLDVTKNDTMLEIHNGNIETRRLYLWIFHLILLH